MKNFIKISFYLCLIFFASCMTLQKDISLSEDVLKDNGFSLEITEKIVLLDAQVFEDASKNILASVQKIILQIDSKLPNYELDKDISARLLALKGKSFFLIGDMENARRMYNQAAKKNADDVELIALASRLGIEKNLSKKEALLNEPILSIELARNAYKNEEYQEAVGLFDRAFLSLPKFYKESYLKVRNNAWALKDTNVLNAQLKSLVSKKNMTTSTMLQITQFSTQHLNIYTGGKAQDEHKLYTTVKKQGLLESATYQTTSLEENAIVTRLGAARFLWNLFCKVTRVDSVKYSKRYKNRERAKSPLKDVPITHEDFDAVIGVVENEIMSLKDGVHFEGEKYVTSEEFYNSVQKIK